MHLAIVKIDFHVSHTISRKDALSGAPIHAFLDGRNEIAVHVLPDERIREFES